jgi:phage gpG-like protein
MAQTDLTIQDFLRLLRGETDTFRKSLQKFTFKLASNIAETADRNAERQFGKTQRTGAKGAPIAGSRGNLQKSIMLEMVGVWPGVVAGGVGVPYAAIHEYGGEIEPVNAKWLTIPAAPSVVGKRAREFPDLKFVRFSPTLAALVFGESWGFRDQPGDDAEDDEIPVAFWLKKLVRIPARPYLRPAADAETDDESIKEVLNYAFGPNAEMVRADRAFGWEIE